MKMPTFKTLKEAEDYGIKNYFEPNIRQLNNGNFKVCDGWDVRNGKNHQEVKKMEEENKSWPDNITAIEQNVKNLSLDNLKKLKEEIWNKLQRIKAVIEFKRDLEDTK